MTEPGDYDYGELMVVQHAHGGGPAALTEALDARAAHRPWRLVDASSGAAFPALDRVRGIIVLGGPMGVQDRTRLAWIERELETLLDALGRGIPVFGICLGVQLLGHALAGEVVTRTVPEIGYLPLTRTAAGRDDPVFAGWPDGSAAFFIHNDEVVRLPEGAEQMLEGSDGVAAWRAPDGQSYGVQFHPEVEAAQVADWCRHPRNQPRFATAGVDPDALAAEALARNRFAQAVGVSLVARWIDQVVGRDDPDPKRGRRARAGV